MSDIRLAEWIICFSALGLVIGATELLGQTHGVAIFILLVLVVIGVPLAQTWLDIGGVIGNFLCARRLSSLREVIAEVTSE